MSSAETQRAQLARRLMDDFAIATGLTGGAPPRRYLWTDAFAVCNFLGLHRCGGEGRFLDLALRLVDQVHHVLGRHRPDDARRGWISGLPEDEGERHPTRGGLRIGKPLPERPPHEPLDPRREWDRDGQYFHYLTQWMHALSRVSQETGQEVFHRWAVELAATAHARFTVSGGARTTRRMVWKLSIDLDRVLVPSMGQHDPLDALLTDLELRSTAPAAAASRERPLLEREAAEAAALCADARWETDDPLGIGALLNGLLKAARLASAGEAAAFEVLGPLARAARAGLEEYSRTAPTAQPAEIRLAFRELGLAIGLHALARLDSSPRSGVVGEAIDALLRYLPLAARIEEFWRDPAHRRGASWTSHQDINAVMLATSLEPGGYLGTA